jgi:DNA repair photolyase
MSGDESKRLPDPPRGRGAVRNVPGRFERFPVAPFDDGWGGLDEPAPKIETTVTDASARTILTTNDSPDIPFNRSINPYKGCEHGCSYCFARPSHAYLDLSPGLDFETRIFSKPDAAALLREAMRKPSYRCESVTLGADTDPYQPVERRLRITRAILEALAEFRHPVVVVTKSNMVVRDMDLLGPMADEQRAAVFVSVTTLDRTLARRMEPRAPTPVRRLEAIRALTRAGVPVGVLASPMIPGLNDHELEKILEAAVEAGAVRASYLLVRLPHELQRVFVDWLETHYPSRAGRVLARIRDLRDGRLSDPRFGSRMRGEGVLADLLQRRYEVATRRLGLQERAELGLDCSGFRVPPERGDQGRLFV